MLRRGPVVFFVLSVVAIALAFLAVPNLGDVGHAGLVDAGHGVGSDLVGVARGFRDAVRAAAGGIGQLAQTKLSLLLLLGVFLTALMLRKK